MRCVWVLLGLIFLTLSGCSGKQTQTPPFDALSPLQPLPREKAHMIRVGYVELAGYPTLGEADRKKYEGLVEKATLEHLGYRVDLKEVWVKPAQKFYQTFEQDLKHPSIQEFLSWDILDGEPKRMKVVSDRLGKKHGEEKVREYLLSEEGKKPVDALLEQSLSLFKTFSTENSIGGKPILNLEEAKYHSYWVMNGIQLFLKDVDLLVVNQLICIPDVWMPLYAMARGGVTTGAVEDSHHRPHGATAFMSLYPFLGKDSLFLKHNPIPDARRLEVAAAYTTHELGHFLERRVEIYDHEGCVSKAATGLNYWKWFKGVEGKTCKREHPTSTSF